MDIHARKIAFIQEFLKLQNEELISLFEKLLRSDKKQEKEYNPMSIEEFYNRIEKSIEDAENGKLTNSNDLITEIEKWS